jgi:hypothetical protein
LWDWLFLGLCVILLLYVADLEGITQMAMADLQKLIENMKRAQSITDKAAADAAKHAIIMDNFEQRLNLNDETMLKIQEYEKLMAQMDASNNGGPALETTFQSSTKIAPIAAPPNPNTGTARFDSTGKQL